MFIIALGQRVSILIESSSGPSKKIDPFLYCVYIYIYIYIYIYTHIYMCVCVCVCVKHFGMANTKKNICLCTYIFVIRWPETIREIISHLC